MKSVEFKQAALTVTSANVAAEVSAISVAAVNSTTDMKATAAARPAAAQNTRPSMQPASPIAAVVDKGAPQAPRFTAEETILLRGLASGASSKDMAAQLRLPRESLYRLLGDLRRKTGASTDAALALTLITPDLQPREQCALSNESVYFARGDPVCPA
jgi:DNA-binding CsgD family transcriptional regulator